MQHPHDPNSYNLQQYYAARQGGHMSYGSGVSQDGQYQPQPVQAVTQAPEPTPQQFYPAALAGYPAQPGALVAQPFVGLSPPLQFAIHSPQFPYFMPMSPTQDPSQFSPPQLTAADAHLVLWATAESHLACAQRLFRAQAGSKAEASAAGSWQAKVVSSLACLYSVLSLCESSEARAKYMQGTVLLGPEIEVRTRLRIAQIVSVWSQDDSEAEQEFHLKRALVVLPTADHYASLKMAIVAMQCRLYMRRGEHKWAEQRMKVAFGEAQKRQLANWVHYFMLELSELYLNNGDMSSAMNTLQFSIRWAKGCNDVVSEAMASVQLLGRLVETRAWQKADEVVESLGRLMQERKVAEVYQITSRFLALKAAMLVMQGKAEAARQTSGFARQVLKSWQAAFVKKLVNGKAADAGSIFVMPGQPNEMQFGGWSYYEAHAWIMLISGLGVRGENSGEEALRFFQMARDGIAKGESDGISSLLVQVKLQVLLHQADAELTGLKMHSAKQTLDAVMQVMAEAVTLENMGYSLGGFWRRHRNEVALRWAMFQHRRGEFKEAVNAYQCVVSSSAPEDIRIVARVNLIVLLLADDRACEETLAKAKGLLDQVKAAVAAGPENEVMQNAVLEFMQGLESEKPVQAKTHLLACLKVCKAIADTTLQGWTLCMLGSVMLPTGQYDQAMKMCATGQAIAQRNKDPLQNAAAIGILTQIERSVGDASRSEQLMQIHRHYIDKFETQASNG
ncbi:hypothetical protein EC988_002142 [Linderina pennispora]|nr:hypothetical protein EC988_002142 [Linderina pennispora]